MRSRRILAGKGYIVAHPMCEPCISEKALLRDRLQKDGYLLIRGMLPVQEVLQVFLDVSSFL